MQVSSVRARRHTHTHTDRNGTATITCARRRNLRFCTPDLCHLHVYPHHSKSSFLLSCHENTASRQTLPPQPQYEKRFTCAERSNIAPKSCFYPSYESETSSFHPTTSSNEQAIVRTCLPTADGCKWLTTAGQPEAPRVKQEAFTTHSGNVKSLLRWISVVSRSRWK